MVGERVPDHHMKGDSMGEERSVSGKDRGAVQSVERALDILQVLTQGSATSGVRFTDIVLQTGLCQATAHRLLSTMKNRGFVEQDRSSRLFYLGFRFLMLGSSAWNSGDLRETARPSLVRLAQRTQDTLYLHLRSGLQSLCIDREEGSFPVKTFTYSVGTHRPLGIGSASLAILAELPEEEIEDILRVNGAHFRHDPSYEPAVIRRQIAQTRTDGYASYTTLKGMAGCAVILRGHKGAPFAAISITAIAERMASPRREEIVAMLKEEAAVIEGVLFKRTGSAQLSVQQ